uniref:Homeobox domain-containing protein n=1 Tax=Oryza rufipogon TaxID=4529 RepID=A0A0E0NUG0_ORYRU
MEGSSNSPDRQSSGGSPPEERGGGGSGGGGGRSAAGEPVRSRWTPKPEQILILESIFNSGMVNPPKDETVRIRKLLERFGAVGDANVFYWFQNRRSRSRRRQRQMQAAAAAAAAAASSSSPSANTSPAAASAATLQVGLPPGAVVHTMAMGGSACQYEQQASSSSSSGSTGGSSLGLFAHGAGASGAGGYLQASCGASASASSALAPGLMGDVVDSGGSDDLFAISRQMGFVGSPRCSPASSPATPSSAATAAQQQFYSCQLPAATITVFINGVPMEMPRGPIDLRAMFGQDVMLVHSTGALLPVNDYGILMQSLQIGESYFLVARPT